MVDAVDWSGLVQEPDTFIDLELRRAESDLLYRAPLRDGGSLYLYLLFEHQRRPDYHDLSQIPDEDIRGAALGRMVQLLLKWADKDDFWQRLPEWLHVMQGILRRPELGMDAIEAMLRYIMRVSAGAPPDDIRPQLRHFLTPKSEELVMTWAEQLRQEGIERGIERERQRAEQEQLLRARARVLRMLGLKFGAPSAEAEQAVEAATLDALEAWTERILLAETAEDVFAEP